MKEGKTVILVDGVGNGVLYWRTQDVLTYLGRYWPAFWP